MLRRLSRWPEGFDELWYGEKRLLTLDSPLCFGTHLFLLMGSLLYRPEIFYYIVIFAGNVYLGASLAYRVLRGRRLARRLAAEGS
jgi:hypothetical protein